MTRSIVSLFSGLGGLDLGFERAGFEVIWANDMAEDAVASYSSNFPIIPVQASLSNISSSEIPSADIVIGGPPCQSFSLVGHRDPDDPRGQLVFRFLEIVRDCEPGAFVMENVPGIAASRVNGVRLTNVLIEAFRELGYGVAAYSLVATDFGVPQLRRRIVIMGARGFTPRRPDGTSFLLDVYGRSDLGISATDAIGDIGPCVPKGHLATYRSDASPSPFARLMRGPVDGPLSLHECPRMSVTDRRLVSHIPPGGNYMDVPDGVATPRILRFKRTGGRTTTYGRLHPSKPSYTINTYFRRPNVGANFHYAEPRLITAREAMRFQSFPDRFEVRSRSQDGRNRLIGNAVPPLMAEGIAWSLETHWGTNAERSDP